VDKVRADISKETLMKLVSFAAQESHSQVRLRSFMESEVGNPKAGHVVEAGE
jgi:hypothetical protein